MSDDLIKEVSKSIQGLFELTTRVDEQAKAIKQQQEKLDHRITEALHGLHTEIKEINSEIHELDKRLTMVEGQASSQENNWKIVISYLLQGCFIIIICYLLYTLKLQTPPLP